MSEFANERPRIMFQNAKRKMRDAFVALGEGRLTYAEAQEKFFDGNEEANQALAAILLMVEGVTTGGDTAEGAES